MISCVYSFIIIGVAQIELMENSDIQNELLEIRKTLRPEYESVVHVIYFCMVCEQIY